MKPLNVIVLSILITLTATSATASNKPYPDPEIAIDSSIRIWAPLFKIARLIELNEIRKIQSAELREVYEDLGILRERITVKDRELTNINRELEVQIGVANMAIRQRDYEKQLDGITIRQLQSNVQREARKKKVNSIVGAIALGALTILYITK